MRAIVLAPTTSSTTTTCRPSCGCRSRCCRPTPAARSRPTRSAATSGTTSRRSRTRTCRRSARSPWYHPLTGEAHDLHDAGRRPRLHAPAVARQPLVDGAVPAEQQRRARSNRARRSRRGCGRSRTRSSRCCGRRSARRTACSATRFPGMIDRTPEPTLPARRRRLSARLPAEAAGGSAPAEGVRRRRHRDRSDSARHAGRPAGQREPALGSGRSGRSASYQRKVADLAVKVAQGSGARCRATPPTSRRGRRSRTSSTRCSR